MSKLNNILTKFKKMPVDGMTKTLFVAITLCLVCSMVVSFAAVNLKEVQEVNKAVDKQKNILQVAGLYYDGIDVKKSFSLFDRRMEPTTFPSITKQRKSSPFDSSIYSCTRKLA